jgi:hypothetical protein
MDYVGAGTSDVATSRMNAPEFDRDTYRSEPYRTDLGAYHGMGGLGYRENRQTATT